MSRPKPDFLLPLPDDLNPQKFRCVTFMVPDDPEWYMSFWGWLYEMGYGKRWEKNPAHDGITVAALWQKIFEEARENFLKRLCEPSVPAGGGLEQEDFMPLRVDCDCNVFVTCCDGTEMQILNADQVRALMNTQPGVGAEQPAAGGGCVTYHGTMGAAGPWYVPTVVNTGDTLEFLRFDGVTNDGGNLAWRTATGGLFLAGADTGITTTVSSDPLNTVPHLKIIINIDGTFYDAFPGPFTVPSGISNGQVTIQVNDDPLANNAGTLTFDLKVCNNQVANFTHTFDFTVSPGPWVNSVLPGPVTMGVWTPGVGWVASDAFLNTLFRRQVVIEAACTSFTMTGAVLVFNNQQGIDAAPTEHAQMFITNGPHFQWDLLMSGAVNGTPATLSGFSTIAGVTSMQIVTQTDTDPSGTGGFTGSCTLTRLTISGLGPDPF